jgi:hypothetical protein
MMKLHTVETVIPEFRGHRDVTTCWFVTKRAFRFQRPYAELIVGYNPAEKDPYAEEAIDELFSEAEAASFVDWLKRNRGATDEDTRIVEAALPIQKNACGFGSIAVGGATDFIAIDEVAERDVTTSPLGFTVLGYFDLRAHEPMDKSVPARHQFCSFYLVDGKMVDNHAELLELWRQGRIVAADEVP